MLIKGLFGCQNLVKAKVRFSFTYNAELDHAIFVFDENVTKAVGLGA